METENLVKSLSDSSRLSTGRRSFLAGTMATAAGAVLLACKKSDDPAPSNNNNNGTTVDLGSGDVGILNYAYALEQLEAAFYVKVLNASQFSTIFTVAEQQVLRDIRDHELIHREFFKAALGTGAIKGLTFKLDAIDFTTKNGVLTAAKTFEDLGVSAYTGAGKLLVTPAYLTIAGKIQSVEARHASLIRYMLNPNSADFAGNDVVDGNGLGKSNLPGVVLPNAQAFIVETITASNLPK